MASGEHPLYDVWGSVSMSLAILDGKITGSFANKNVTTKKNPSERTITKLSGTYATAMGSLELFGKGEELYGSLDGQEFKIEQVSNFYITSSSDSQLDGLMMEESNGKIELTDRKFAYKIE